MDGARETARRQCRRLAAAWPEADCALHHDGPWQLLVATVLSAQTTDERVNQVTPALFARWPGPEQLAGAERSEVQAVIAPLGMGRAKAGYLVDGARALLERHGGEVPDDQAALESLPGVGRKTAHVVRGNAFGASLLTVDTHVGRLARRLGWTEATAPRAVEDDVVALVGDEDLTRLSHRLIAHGRAVCTARAPRCAACVLAPDCPSAAV